MNAASKYAFLKKKKAGAPKNFALERMPILEEEEPDTNVISVTFSTLKQAEENLQMGDAYFCKHCKSCLSSISKLYAKPEYQEKFPVGNPLEEDKEEEKKLDVPHKSKGKVIANIPDGQKVWVCEFCGEHNLVHLDQEEIPKQDDVIYLLQSAQQMSKNPSDLSSDISMIFCIDNSGSMSVTTEIKGTHDFKHGLSPEEYEMLKQFIEQGADQHLPGQKKGTTFVSRKQCVLAAIEDQLVQLKAEYPNRKIGLVTFNDEVCVVGDGKNLPEIITGDKLYKYDVLKQAGEILESKLISTTVKESAENLLKTFEKMKEFGKTALGPALLVSLGLAVQGKQGSRIILCTDGLANVGLGEMDTPDGLAKAEQFYTELAMFAKQNGVSVSVISIKGEGCKLDILGKVADITSGSLTRVDPNEITGKFANIMKEEVIGTQMEVKLRVHQGLRFRNEAAEFLKEGGSLFEKNIGNVTAKTELTFEYEMRPDEELVELGIDASKLERVPFQAQIVYNSSNGDRLMRVITKSLQTTQNLEEAEKDVNVKLLAARALQQQAKLASKGMYAESNKVGGSWGKYFDTRVSSKVSTDVKSEEVLNKFHTKSIKMQQVAMKRETAPLLTMSKGKEMMKEKEKPKPVASMMMEKPKPMAPVVEKKAMLKSKAPAPKPVMSMAKSMPRGAPLKMAKGKVEKVEKVAKKEVEVQEEGSAEEDAEYELFHEAKNCNSNFDEM